MRSPHWFPRTYATALLGAFAVVIAPLAIAVALASLQIYDLAERSEASVARAALLGAQSRALRESLVEVERTTRQAAVLGTAAVLETYTRHADRLDQAAAQVARATAGDEAQTQLVALRVAASALTEDFLNGQPQAALAALTPLAAAADALDGYTQAQIARERAALAALPARVSSQLAWIAVLAVPLALVLAVWFASRLGTPVRRVGDAMRRLGDGDLATPVAVRGPSEIAQLGDGLEWLRQRLVALESARERFLRGVSHDLKTPIAAIAEGGALLGDELYGTLAPKQRAVVDLITKNAARLLERIETLLRAASMAPGAPPPQASAVDLAQIVRGAVDDQRLALEHRRLKIATHLAPAAVNGDVERLRIVVDNLLSNAVKVSPDGGTIEVTLAADGVHARLDVVDQGPGVAPGEEEKIFRLGTRGSAAQLLGTRGSGQGLAIAREFAQTVGGQVFAAPVGGDSRSGARANGARFVVMLPLAHAQTAPLSGADDALPSSDVSRPVAHA